jgi:hypothetical protein
MLEKQEGARSFNSLEFGILFSVDGKLQEG